MEGNFLITTNAWFVAPDGKQYKSVWGEVKIVGDEVLGIKTNARSSNWFARVGSEENFIIVAGCQIHYAVKCEEKPHKGQTQDWSQYEGGVKEYYRPSMIYIAE